MSAQEFYEKMCEIADDDDDDYEVSHITADHLMMDLLRQLGYGAGVDVFDNMPKWYA